jgi:hypothetical protein
MIRARKIVSLVSGSAPARVWRDMIREERPVSGDPVGCATCPLRRGGEWEAGALAALAEDPGLRRGLPRFGCHEVEGRPCAGARRVARKASRC